MGRHKEELVQIKFSVPPDVAESLSQKLIDAGFVIERNTSQGKVLQPGWRKWAEAVYNGKVFLAKILE